MSPFVLSTFIVVTLLFLVPKDCDGVECYACTSASFGQDKCADPFSSEERSSLAKVDCKSNELCIKTALKSKLVNTFSRGCSLQILGVVEDCKSTMVGESETVNCFCSSNLCNGAEQMNLMSVLGLISIGLLGKIAVEYLHKQ